MALERVKPNDRRTIDIKNYMNNLWENIKNAPFESYESENTPNFNDDTLLYKGRLMEENGRLRFIEDDRNKLYCKENHCMDGVKALWTVRMRGPNTGYDYEVIPNKHRQVTQTLRPQRTLWIHKNIIPQKHSGRQLKYHTVTDRLFASLFMDDDYDIPRRQPRPTPPLNAQYSKVGYAGAPSDAQQYKKPPPYGYKPYNQVKYSRPPIAHTPASYPQPHHYLDIDGIGVVSNPYIPQSPDIHSPHNPPKQPRPTRPAFLPTPVNLPLNNNNNNDTVMSSSIKPNIKDTNVTNFTTKSPEVKPNTHKPMQTSIKVNYFTDHVRPPVYNAPPGVFVTMDKKPFKPMPPLKLYSPKATKKPLDFRPSPQVLDVQQFSQPDSVVEDNFRPIAVNRIVSSTTKETNIAQDSKTEQQIFKKYNISDIKEPKKQLKKKPQRVTTTTTTTFSTTGSTDEDYESMSWGSLLGAFSKTTPMESEEEKVKTVTTTTAATIVNSSSSPSTSTKSIISTTEEHILEHPTTTTSTTTTTTTKPTPTRRTRPPPDFNKNKIRKHKRVTSTTTKAPEKSRRPTSDLTPQASSAITSATRATTRWTPSSTSTTQVATTPSTTTSSSTEYRSTFNTETSTTSETIPMKRINRYRQSALMHKGTSVKQDKNTGKNSSRPIIPPTGQFPPRRKASNFHGYIKPTTEHNFNESEEESSEDYVLVPTSAHYKAESVNEASTEKIERKTFDLSNSVNNEKYSDEYENETEPEIYSDHMDVQDYADEENIEEDSKEQSLVSTTTAYSVKINEIESEEIPSTQIPVVDVSSEAPKNKTKCKRRKLKTTTTTTEPTTVKEAEETTSTVSMQTTTENDPTPDIFDELFDFNFDDSTEVKTNSNNSTLKEQHDVEYDGTENHEDYEKPMDFPDLFDDNFNDEVEIEHSIDENDEILYNEDNYDFDNSQQSDDESEFEDEKPSSRESKHDKQLDDDDNDDHSTTRPYSIFELMAME